eukprot:CAMPEP_0181418604 /NCGR_PEP_ID=MMETSP1110-20121109/11645_1 /TAXON_ID=174948 /ORGANISM="Symbiodinium sp., Strain CCMP421" /LENGTH=53 /DNA_ID=CAMNT_0023541597 /DNA_START=77 /DNA_END=238 /DNA_ORIENTATION=-
MKLFLKKSGLLRLLQPNRPKAHHDGMKTPGTASQPGAQVRQRAHEGKDAIAFF